MLRAAKGTIYAFHELKMPVLESAKGTSWDDASPPEEQFPVPASYVTATDEAEQSHEARSQHHCAYDLSVL